MPAIYDVLHKLDNKFTPGTTKFSDYVINTSDFNGDFLRTCFRKKTHQLKNYDLRESDLFIIAFSRPFKPNQLRYTSDCLTVAKIQFWWFEQDGIDIDDEIQLNIQLGYQYIYKYDLKKDELEEVDISNM